MMIKLLDTVGFDYSVLFLYCLQFCVSHSLVSTKANAVSPDFYSAIASGCQSLLLTSGNLIFCTNLCHFGQLLYSCSTTV